MKQEETKRNTPKDAYDLPNLHTKVLMKYLDHARHFGGEYDPINSGKCISIADIKEELAKRPHVLNKKEAREKRQQLAKVKK